MTKTLGSVNTSALIPMPLYIRLEMIAKKENVSQAEIIRRALEVYLKKGNK